MALDVPHGRSPGVRRFEVTPKPTGKRGERVGLVTSDCELELSIWTFRCSGPNVERDLRMRPDEEEPLSVLLGEAPPLGERTLGIGSCCDEVGIVVLPAKEAHDARILGGGHAYHEHERGAGSSARSRRAEAPASRQARRLQCTAEPVMQRLPSLRM
jgi:hypothetical protein